jgi:hypothetical protein
MCLRLLVKAWFESSRTADEGLPYGKGPEGRRGVAWSGLKSHGWLFAATMDDGMDPLHSANRLRNEP